MKALNLSVCDVSVLYRYVNDVSRVLFHFSSIKPVACWENSQKDKIKYSFGYNYIKEK